MLKLHIDFHPFGDPKSKRIGELKIWNDGTNDKRPEYGNYQYEISDIPAESYNQEIFTKGEFKNFKRKEGCWCLISKILSDIGLPKLNCGDN